MRMSFFASLAVLAMGGAAAAATGSAPIADGWYLLGKEVTRPDAPPQQRHPQVFEAGTGVVAGAKRATAVYLSGDASGPEATKLERMILSLPQESFARYGGLQRRIPLAAWRGKRLRITAYLKSEGDAHAYISAQINTANLSAVRTASALNRRHDEAWAAHGFVLDVPDSATDLVLTAGLTGKGRIWLDGLTLEAVTNDVPLSWSERLANRANIVFPDLAGYIPVSSSASIAALPGPLRRDQN